MGKPLNLRQANEQLQNVPGWELHENGKVMYRKYVTRNFLAAVHFIDEVAKVAEADNHHPDIHLTGYRNLRIDLSTHAISGLSENDFILAAKINQLPVELKK